MNTGVKIILYVVLVTFTAVTGLFFFKEFGRLFEDDKPKTEAVAEAQPAAPTDAAATGDTNAVASTNAAGDTNAIAPVTNAAPATNVTADVSTNTAAADTNTIAATTNAPPSEAKTSAKTSKKTAKANAVGKEQKPRLGFWTVWFLLSVIALGAFIAWDVSNFVANRAHKTLYNYEDPEKKDPEYEEAEKVWANGQHLDAIRMMRDYLKTHPREVHVSLRIAEIYEKDLNNQLAAALEYEDVLTKKLEPERWGWAAIHLCNLYFKLNREDDAFAMLQRIIKDYGETQAADKARKRLKEVAPQLLAEAEESTTEIPASSAAPEAPKSNLPPGFRPKK